MESESVSRPVVSDSLQPHGLVLQAPLSMGFSRQEYWSVLLFPSPGDLPKPGIELSSPALQAGSLLSEPPGRLPTSGPVGKSLPNSGIFVLSPNFCCVHKPSVLSLTKYCSLTHF